MSTMGPLCPEFPTQEETLEEVWDARRVLQWQGARQRSQGGLRAAGVSVWRGRPPGPSGLLLGV